LGAHEEDGKDNIFGSLSYLARGLHTSDKISQIFPTIFDAVYVRIFLNWGVGVGLSLYLLVHDVVI